MVKYYFYNVRSIGFIIYILCSAGLKAQTRFQITTFAKTCDPAAVYLSVQQRMPQDSIWVEWSTGEKNTFQVNGIKPGLHLVGISHIWYAGTKRMVKDTVMVFEIKNVGCDIIVPSFFSPNGDGINDVLEIQNIEYFPEFRMDVYNQNGNRVLHQEQNYVPWNGTWLDLDLPVGDYVMVFFKSKRNLNDAKSYAFKILK